MALLTPALFFPLQSHWFQVWILINTSACKTPGFLLPESLAFTSCPWFSVYTPPPGLSQDSLIAPSSLMKLLLMPQGLSLLILCSQVSSPFHFSGSSSTPFRICIFSFDCLCPSILMKMPFPFTMVFFLVLWSSKAALVAINRMLHFNLLKEGYVLWIKRFKNTSRVWYLGSAVQLVWRRGAPWPSKI